MRRRGIEGVLDFALALQHELPATDNLVWSPYSVASAVGLAAAGARGETHEELARALRAAPESLMRTLTESASLPNAEVAVANTLWTRSGPSFNEEYRRAVAASAGGALRDADFRGDPEGARKAINADVAKTTRKLIKELLQPGSVTPDTVAVIANALYLKAAWRKVFAKSATRPGPFEGPGGRRDVPMMRQTERMPYAAADGWRMVTLATESDVVVDIVVGGDVDPTPESLARLRSHVGNTKVALAMPRFRVESGARLVGPLRALGVTAAFDPEAADFSGITDERLWVDEVEHKAVLDLDEDGFEGAAATAIAMRGASFDTEAPVEFTVDRPFHVVVRHADTDVIFFLARVREPQGTT